MSWLLASFCVNWMGRRGMLAAAKGAVRTVLAVGKARSGGEGE